MDNSSKQVHLTLQKVLAGNPEVRRLLASHLTERNRLLLQQLRAAPNWDTVNVTRGSLAENEALLNALEYKEGE